MRAHSLVVFTMVLSGCLAPTTEVFDAGVDSGVMETVDAGPPVLWRTEWTAFTAHRSAGYFEMCRMRSTWQVDLTTGVVDFTSCGAAARSLVMSQAQLASLRTALHGLKLPSDRKCGADKPGLSIEVSDVVLYDDFYACFARPGITYVEGIDAVFSVLQQL